MTVDLEDRIRRIPLAERYALIERLETGHPAQCDVVYWDALWLAIDGPIQDLHPSSSKYARWLRTVDETVVRQAHVQAIAAVRCLL